VVEPLIEGMYALASDEHEAFASAWLVANGAAAANARTAHGAFGRFFDGPPPDATVTQWQANGGFALAFAAAALSPATTIAPSPWSDASYVTDDITALPATLTFDG